MVKQDLISVGITFVMGMLVGGYLYFTEFVSGADVLDGSDSSTFVLTSEAYGGCDPSCPSFRLNNDGTYIYRYTPAEEQSQVKRDGVLPLTIQKDLKKALDIREIKAQSKDVVNEVCTSDSEGVDVFYDMTYKDEDYTLDSCGTAVDGESDLWLALYEIWNYLQTQK